MTAARLGAVQKAVLAALLAAEPLTAPELADLSWASTPENQRSATLNALKALRLRGLAVTAGRAPVCGRGGQPFRWVLTEAGREMARRTGGAQ